MVTDRINLLQKKRREPLKISVLSLKSAGLASVVTFLLLLTLCYSKYQDVQKQQIVVDQFTSQLAVQKAEVDRLKVNANTLSGAKQAQMIAHFVNKKHLLSDLMKELSLIIPPKTWLTGFTMKTEESKRKVTITAETPGPQMMNEFLQSLEGSYFYREARLIVSEQLEGASPALLRFQTEAVIKENSFTTTAEVKQ